MSYSFNMTSPNRRVFVGISIPYEELNSFPEMLKKLKIFSDKRSYDIKWVPSDNLHLSLQFLGSLNEETVIKVEKTLNAVLKKQESLKLDIRNVDAFGSIEKGRLVWMGVRSSTDLLDIQSRIREECNNILPEENQDHKEFQPHISIARLRNQKHLKALLEPFLRKKFGSIKVTEICLFESAFHNRMPVYNKIKSWKLS